MSSPGANKWVNKVTTSYLFQRAVKRVYWSKLDSKEAEYDDDNILERNANYTFTDIKFELVYDFKVWRKNELWYVKVANGDGDTKSDEGCNNIWLFHPNQGCREIKEIVRQERDDGSFYLVVVGDLKTEDK